MRRIKLCLFLICLCFASFESHAGLFGRDGFFQRNVWDNTKIIANTACDFITTTVEDVFVNPIATLTGAHVNIVAEDQWITVGAKGEIYWGGNRQRDFRKYYKVRYQKTSDSITSMRGDVLVAINNQELQEVIDEPMSEMEKLLHANTQKLMQKTIQYQGTFSATPRHIQLIARELVPIVNKNKELGVMEQYLKQLSDAEYNELVGEKPLETVYPEDWIGLTSMAFLATKVSYVGIKILARELSLTGTISAITKRSKHSRAIYSKFLDTLRKFGFKGKDVAPALSKIKSYTPRTTRKGLKGIDIFRNDGSKISITPQRVKEFVPNNHPSAPQGVLQKVKFKNSQFGSKGFKRDPTTEELALLEALWKK